LLAIPQSQKRKSEQRNIMNSTSYTDEELCQAIEQGMRTEEYRADCQHVIQELNRLRATEIASYLQYKQHAYMAVSLLSPGLKQDFQAHADIEFKHADQLGERIQQLGGVPLFNPAELGAKAAEEGVHPTQGATLHDMVVENLILERQQVAAYTALIRELGDDDLITRQILLTILADTEQHASELADYLKRTAETQRRDTGTAH
jgi:bacterioferritin